MRNINYTSLANVIFQFRNSSGQEKMIPSFLDRGKFCPILFPKMNRQWTTYPYYLDRDTAANCSRLAFHPRSIFAFPFYLPISPCTHGFHGYVRGNQVRDQVMAEISKVNVNTIWTLVSSLFGHSEVINSASLRHIDRKITLCYSNICRVLKHVPTSSQLFSLDHSC